jgi:hypothetical protein
MLAAERLVGRRRTLSHVSVAGASTLITSRVWKAVLGE